jgi:hypothetical protein
VCDFGDLGKRYVLHFTLYTQRIHEKWVTESICLLQSHAGRINIINYKPSSPSGRNPAEAVEHGTIENSHVHVFLQLRGYIAIAFVKPYSIYSPDYYPSSALGFVRPRPREGDNQGRILYPLHCSRSVSISRASSTACIAATRSTYNTFVARPKGHL